MTSPQTSLIIDKVSDVHDNQTGSHHSDSMLHSWGNGSIFVLHKVFQNTGCGLST